MKKRKYLLIIMIVVFLFSVGGTFFILKNKFGKKDLLDELININQLDDAFMDRYYKEMDQLLKSDNIDNVLIVVSKKEPENNYGAINVVEAPNHIFFLEYDSVASRYNAKQRLEKDEKIYSVTENRHYTITDTDDSDPLDSDVTVSGGSYMSWGIKKSGLDHAIDYINQEIGDQAQDVVAAIIDTGCDMDQFNNYFPGKIEEVYNLYDNNAMYDRHGHGTHIAGTIAEGTPDNVKILPVKVGDTDDLNFSAILSAVTWITDGHKADVINMSYGGAMPANVETDPEYIVIEAARREGIISVAAAGNEGTSVYESPASFDNTLSISAVDSNLNRAKANGMYFSNYNDAVSFAAPGQSISSIGGSKSGTSMATPHVVCAVAFLKSIQKNLSLEMTLDALKNNVVDLGAPGKDIYFGYGFIDLSHFVLCDENNSSSACTSLTVSNDFIPTSLEVVNVKTTNYNYGSYMNIMPTEIKITGSNHQSRIMRLDDLEDAVLSGYQPYTTGTQTVTVQYSGLTTSFQVSHTSNYETGWLYENALDDNNNITSNYSIIGYKDNGLSLKKLYFPDKINNHNVVSIMPSSSGTSNVFTNSTDALSYSEVYLSRNITKVGSSVFKDMTNLTTVTSYASSLEVYTQAFEGLQFLTTVDANILFHQDAYEVFSGDESLQSVRLDYRNTIIPIKAFYQCRNLESITFPQKLVEIKEYAFAESGIKKPEFNSGLKVIGNEAFGYSDVEEVVIPSSVNSIGRAAFYGPHFNKVSVSSGNAKYDSRDNCNAIIEKSTNTLILASNSTNVVPSSVKIIGSYAFKRTNIMRLELQDGVETIQENAFYEFWDLDVLIVPTSVTSISDSSFYDTGYFSFGPIIYTYSSAYAYNYALNHTMAYLLLDETQNPPYDVVMVAFNLLSEQIKVDYRPFEKVNPQDYPLMLHLYETESSEFAQQEVIENCRVIYEGGRDSFRYGDHYVWLVYESTTYGIHNMVMKLSINIAEQLTPEYEDKIPTDLYANVNNTLADVDLPDGFQWEAPETLITLPDDQVYYATYYPDDMQNYSIVNHIPITVHVIEKTIVKPLVLITNREYDGTVDISNDVISIYELVGNDYSLNDSDYSIISASFDNATVGLRKASIKLRLSDEKYESCVFSNGEQEKVFELYANINPKRIPKPSLVEQQYVYNGTDQTLLFDNFDDFDENKMTISGNVQKNAGSYTVVLSLTDDNYAWVDDDERSITYTFTIEKASIGFSSNNIEVEYDGLSHGIEVTPVSSNVSIKYMDEAGNYTLDEMPMYVYPGVYTIKYMLIIDDNYEPAYGENTLTIIANGIVNKTVDYEVVYDGEYHSLQMDVAASNYTIYYSEDNVNFDSTELPQYKEVGEYTVYYRIDSEGFPSVTASNKVRIFGITKVDSSVRQKDNTFVVSNSSFNTLKNKITTYSKSTNFYHYTREDSLTSSDKIKTGDMIKIEINNTMITYKIALLGDTSGDGKINYLDYVNVYNHIQKVAHPTLNKKLLVGEYLLAADMTGDNKISYLDYVRIYNKIKG